MRLIKVREVRIARTCVADEVREDRIAGLVADTVMEDKIAWTCCEADKVRVNRITRTCTLTQMGRCIDRTKI